MPPGTSAVAFNCVALSAVPGVMFAGVVHVMTGVRLTTVSGTVFVIGANAVLVGVKVTDSVRWPTASTVPAAGEYDERAGHVGGRVQLRRAQRRADGDRRGRVPRHRRRGARTLISTVAVADW